MFNYKYNRLRLKMLGKAVYFIDCLHGNWLNPGVTMWPLGANLRQVQFSRLPIQKGIQSDTSA